MHLRTTLLVAGTLAVALFAAAPVAAFSTGDGVSDCRFVGNEDYVCAGALSDDCDVWVATSQTGDRICADA